VASSSGLNKVVCEDCGADLTFDGSKRVIVVERTPDDKALDEQVKASEKAALAAKKVRVVIKGMAGLVCCSGS